MIASKAVPCTILSDDPAVILKQTVFDFYNTFSDPLKNPRLALELMRMDPEMREFVLKAYNFFHKLEEIYPELHPTLVIPPSRSPIPQFPRPFAPCSSRLNGTHVENAPEDHTTEETAPVQDRFPI